MSQELDLSALDVAEEVKVEIPKVYQEEFTVGRNKKKVETGDFLRTCLRNERITVRHIAKEGGMITNPKHVLYGGMAENATRTFTVPFLRSSGAYVNVLTNDEKNFLEDYMGLEPNALSVYLKTNNYWDNFTVRLTKQDMFLDLSNPNDYIKYKVLLANNEHICKSISDLSERPKITYQYVLVNDNDEVKEVNKQMDSSMEAYKLFGKYQEEYAVLKYIIETTNGRPVSSDTNKMALQTMAYKAVTANPKLFVQVAQDKDITMKVLIMEAVGAGLIRKRGDLYYLTDSNTPLCSNGSEDPTLNAAVKYLNAPKNQVVKLSLEAKIKLTKE